ncbi:MAG: hypothetical protein LBH30_07675 [Prevotellaceae bacterium]|nr:hypothetical protein [Prevotellaceae bacterium]
MESHLKAARRSPARKKTTSASLRRVQPETTKAERHCEECNDEATEAQRSSQ